MHAIFAYDEKALGRPFQRLVNRAGHTIGVRGILMLISLAEMGGSLFAARMLDTTIYQGVDLALVCYSLMIGGGALAFLALNVSEASLMKTFRGKPSRVSRMAMPVFALLLLIQVGRPALGVVALSLLIWAYYYVAACHPMPARMRRSRLQMA